MKALFTQALSHYHPLVAAKLRGFFAHAQHSRFTELPLDSAILPPLERLTTRGKMFRASFLLSIVEAISDQGASDSAVSAAAAVELIGSALLVHDDIMDQDDLRRNEASLHKQFEVLAQNHALPRAKHFGLSTAICAGDLALFQGFELLTQSGLPPTLIVELITISCQVLRTIALGQIEDLRLSNTTSATEAEILAMYREKTAEYTGFWPMKLALALVPPPAISHSLEKELLTIATEIGLLYQLVDDRLGFCGTETTIGKSTNTDIIQDKKTLYWLYLKDRTTAAHQTRLATIFGNPSATQEDIDWVKSVAEETGISQEIDKYIEEKKQSTKAMIESSSAPGTLKTLLHSVLAFITEREK